MLSRYQLKGQEVDSLDLKSLIVTGGVKVDDDVYREFGKDFRIDPDPLNATA